MLKHINYFAIVAHDSSHKHSQTLAKRFVPIVMQRRTVAHYHLWRRPIVFEMLLDKGERGGIVMVSAQSCGARGTPCALVTLLKTPAFSLNLRFSYRGVVCKIRKS